MSSNGRRRKALIWLIAIIVVLFVPGVALGCEGGHGEGGLDLGQVTTTK